MRSARDLRERVGSRFRLATDRGGARQPGGPVANEQRYWEAFYGRGYDPFGLDTNPLERLKYQTTLAVCGEGPFGEVLEIGCAVGTFTELLAPRCQSLLAVDISATAVERAADRLAGLSNVKFEVRDLPADLPAGPFDLIVASDVLYYWSTTDLVAVMPRLEAALTSGGALIAVDYTPPVVGALQAGDDVHDTIIRMTSLQRPFTIRTEFGAGRTYRIDRLVRLREVPGFRPEDVNGVGA